MSPSTASVCAAASTGPAPSERLPLTMNVRSDVHMLHAFSTKLQAAAGTLTVPPDSGEVVEALELIKTLPLEGAGVA